MELHFHKKYKDCSDEEIVSSILLQSHDEEAAVYLLYNRYAPLLRNVYRRIYENDISWYGDCIDDLYLFLQGNDKEWSKLKTFEWRSGFATWLSRTAYNRFLEQKTRLMGKIRGTISIDDGHGNKSIMQIPSENEHEYGGRERNILLLEAVGMLKDADQKFVILKRLQGYNSKEIALLMQKRWEKHGIVKYNKKNQIVVPDAAYVDVRTQRAKDNLAIILKNIR